MHLKCTYYHYYNICPTVGNNVFNDVNSILAICHSLQKYLGTIFSHDICSSQNSIHPQEMEITPPKTGCVCLCGVCVCVYAHVHVCAILCLRA